MNEQTKSEIEEAAEAIDRAKERNEIAKNMLNLPDEFNVNGHSIKVRHLPPDSLVPLNMALTDFHAARLEIIKLRDEKDDTEKYRKIKEIIQGFRDAANEILFYLINPDPDEPIYPKEWIGKNLPVTGSKHPDIEDSVGLQIIRSFKERIEFTDFFVEAWGIPVL